MSNQNCIITGDVAIRKMERMALEIAENLFGDDAPLVLIGISGGGMVVAAKMRQLLTPLLQNVVIRLVSCTINKNMPLEVGFDTEPDFTGCNVIVVDDVTNSGRTFLYALKPLLGYLPKSIQTLCLVERMHKSFPVKMDYVGLSIATTLHDHIDVEVKNGEVTGAYMQ